TTTSSSPSSLSPAQESVAVGLSSARSIVTVACVRSSVCPPTVCGASAAAAEHRAPHAPASCAAHHTPARYCDWVSQLTMSHASSRNCARAIGASRGRDVDYCPTRSASRDVAFRYGEPGNSLHARREPRSAPQASLSATMQAHPTPAGTLLVLELSESFSAAWPTLARDAGLQVEAADCAASFALAGPDVVGLVAAGGEEQRLEPTLRSLDRPRAEIAAVVAEGDHRLAASAIRAGASEFFVLTQDYEQLAAWLRDQGRRLAA